MKAIEDMINFNKVSKDGLKLQYVENQTPAICIAAINNNPDAFKMVRKQTPEICMAAVKKDWRLLKYVESQTEKMCIEAINKNPFAIQYVKNQTDYLCTLALRQNGDAIKFVENQTYSLCLLAFKSDSCGKNKNGYALQYIKNQTPEICLAAAEHWTFFEYINPELLNKEICAELIKTNPWDIRHVPDHLIDKDLTMLAVSHKDLYKGTEIYKFLKITDEDVLIKLVENLGISLKDIPAEKQTRDICLAAVKQNGMALEFCSIKDEEIMLNAVYSNRNAFKFVQFSDQDKKPEVRQKP